MYIHIYTYTYLDIHTSICIHTYMCIYIYTHLETGPGGLGPLHQVSMAAPALQTPSRTAPEPSRTAPRRAKKLARRAQHDPGKPPLAERAVQNARDGDETAPDAPKTQTKKKKRSRRWLNSVPRVNFRVFY